MVEDITCYARRALDTVLEQRRKDAEGKNAAAPLGRYPVVRPHDPDRDPPPAEPKKKSRA